MRLNRFHIILVIALSAFAIGCEKTPEIWDSSRAFKTQIVVGTSSGIEFQTVELEGVKDQKTLKGDIVEFYLSPGEKNSEIMGRPAIARFIQDSEGVHIPVNSLSLQMVSLYYHMQSLKKLEVESYGRTFVEWPRKIGLRVQTNNPDTRSNNAFYSSQLDVIYFVPYSEDQLPLPLNGGVIAHEHFHSYFAKGLQNQLDQKNLKPIDQYILKSINEGLADVWGWIYSGQPDFISQSLPDVGQFRKLDSSKLSRLTQVKSKSDLENDIKFSKVECKNISWCSTPDQIILSLSYMNGTAIARILKDSVAGQKLNQTQKAQKIVQLLEKLSEVVKTQPLSLENVILEWSKLFDSLSEVSCEVLKNSIKTQEVKDEICTKL